MTFDTDVLKFVKKMERRFDTYTQELGLALSVDLIQETPVVSGRLKAAWHVSQTPFGQAPNNNKDKGGSATITKIHGQLKSVKGGSVYYIINNATSQPGDRGGAGIKYSQRVNETFIRYDHDIYFLNASLQSLGFFNRGTNYLPHGQDPRHRLAVSIALATHR